MKKNYFKLICLSTILSFGYCIASAQNNIPVTNNDVINGSRNKPEDFDVTWNDLVSEDDFFYIFEEPKFGSVEIIENGKVRYTPKSEFCGVDYFVYQYCNLQGCDQGVVKAIIKCDYVKIFNGFSPNGDGMNDTFTIDGLENYPDNELTIFNRWGNQVFYQKNYQSTFDGSWAGKMLTDGFYVYILELNDEEKTVYKGSLNIHK